MDYDEWLKYVEECNLRGKPVLFGPSPTKEDLIMSKKESNPSTTSRRPEPPPAPPRKSDFQDALETEVDPTLFFAILGGLILAALVGLLL